MARKVVCPKCNAKLFGGGHGVLKRHFIEKHPEYPFLYTRRENSTNYIMTCGKCSKAINSYQRLIDHKCLLKDVPSDISEESDSVSVNRLFEALHDVSGIALLRRIGESLIEVTDRFRTVTKENEFLTKQNVLLQEENSRAIEKIARIQSSFNEF